jgi:hypothetical protein
MLNREEIAALPAGPEFDELLGVGLGIVPSEKWHIVDKTDGGSYIKFNTQQEATSYHAKAQVEYPIGLLANGVVVLIRRWPAFSADIAAAWQVVERLTADGWGHKHHVLSAAAEQPGWQWTFMRPGGGLGAGIAGAEADTAPLAICRAALLALAPTPSQNS